MPLFFYTCIESSCYQTTSFKLLGVRIELPEQVCGALECDARENVGPSLALEDKDDLAELAGKRAVALKQPRLVWTQQLHRRFVDAVAHLGGINNAVPKTIMQLMSVEGLTRQHVASHLHKYRLYLERMQGISEGPLCPSNHSVTRWRERCNKPTPVPHSLREPTPVPRCLHECQDSESLHDLKTKEIDTSSEDVAGDLMQMYNCSKDSMGDLTEMSTFSEAFSDLTEIE